MSLPAPKVPTQVRRKILPFRRAPATNRNVGEVIPFPSPEMRDESQRAWYKHPATVGFAIIGIAVILIQPWRRKYDP